MLRTVTLFSHQAWVYISWIRFLALLEILDSLCKEILTGCQGIYCNCQMLVASSYQKVTFKYIYRYMHIFYWIVLYVEWTFQWPWNKDVWPGFDTKTLDTCRSLTPTGNLTPHNSFLTPPLAGWGREFEG